MGVNSGECNVKYVCLFLKNIKLDVQRSAEQDFHKGSSTMRFYSMLL